MRHGAATDEPVCGAEAAAATALSCLPQHSWPSSLDCWLTVEKLWRLHYAGQATPLLGEEHSASTWISRRQAAGEEQSAAAFPAPLDHRGRFNLQLHDTIQLLMTNRTH